MTENEAIKAIEHDLEWHSKELQPKYKEVLRYVIQALEEIQQYRAIGTVDEFKTLKDKNEPKKVANGISFFKCPSCGSGEIEEFYETGGSNKHNYCPDCGQKLDWQLKE